MRVKVGIKVGLRVDARHSLRLNDQSQTAANHAVAVATAERCLHPADALVRHALHEADIEADLVPLDDSAGDLEEGQAHARLPVLGRLEDEVVERVADLPGIVTDWSMGMGTEYNKYMAGSD